MQRQNSMGRGSGRGPAGRGRGPAGRGPQGRGPQGRGASNGRGGGRTPGRGGRGGGGGRGGPSLPTPTECLSNLMITSITPNFQFHQYGLDAVSNTNGPVDSRRRRQELLQLGLFGDQGLLRRNGMSPKDVESLKRVVFFEGSFIFSARPIPGLERDTLPRDIVGSKSTGSEEELPLMDNGDSMTVTNWSAFTVPNLLRPPQPPKPACTPVKPPEKEKTASNATVNVSLRCADCTKAFTDLNGLKTHCQSTGHRPQVDQELTPAALEVFTSFCNCALQRAMNERMARWGREYIDPKSAKEPKDRQGRSMGVTIYRAYSCEFGVHKPHGLPPSLTLTVDLRAKVIRTRHLLNQICDDKDPNTVQFRPQDISKAIRTYKGEVVICTYDKRCYSVVDLDFKHSPATLPVEGLGISHAEYFTQRKKIALKYPNCKPMVAVLGRNNSTIHLPAELVCFNELDPFVKQQLPLIASFTPEQRHLAIEEMKRYLTPGAQKTKGKGGGLLPAIGLTLEDKRIKCQVEVLPLPLIRVSGLVIPKEKGMMWAPIMNTANYNVDPGRAVKLNVVLVYNKDLKQCANRVYDSVRNLVNKFNASYRFGDKPFAMVEAGDSEKHWGAIERHFSQKQPKNVFVLDLAKPPRRAALDPAYSVVKLILTKNGYLSQFINFNTYDHGNPRDERKSSTILQGVARQVLSKCGVRIWWVSLPREIPVPTVFVGVDVFHAPRKYSEKDGKRLAKESVAAVIVQVIRSHEQNRNGFAEVYSETFRRKAGLEMQLGDCMKTTVGNALKIMKVNPMSCVVWRDGVGDAAINQVAQQEIPAVREALMGPKIVGATADKIPRAVPLSYIVVQKRIATKFLSLDGKHAMPTGSLVISLQGTEHGTFYIQGTSPSYSTPKPARFIIAQMDNGIVKRKKALAELSWALCHDYSNWTGPIKLPSPVQMAHKLAELAGGFSDCGDSINNTAFAGKIHFL